MDTFLSILGPGLLLVGLVIGYLIWVRPRHAHSGLAERLLLMVIVLTTMGGLIGSPFWWADINASFAWDVPPLATRMLASAGFSFFVAGLLALRRPSFRRVRLILIMLLVYLLPLAVAIVLFHRDRFDPSAFITPGFFLVVGILALGALWFFWRQPRVIAASPMDDLPTQPWTRGWFLAVALVTGLWGLALFLTDQGPTRLIWAWPGDLLSSRLIGVMLLTVAAGSLYSLRHQDPARLMLAVLTTYGFGLALASLWSAWVGKPVIYSYLSVFLLIGLVSAVLLRLERPQAVQLGLPHLNR